MSGFINYKYCDLIRSEVCYPPTRTTVECCSYKNRERRGTSLKEKFFFFISGTSCVNPLQEAELQGGRDRDISLKGRYSLKESFSYILGTSCQLQDWIWQGYPSEGRVLFENRGFPMQGASVYIDRLPSYGGV
jgi:hypothetical protein